MKKIIAVLLAALVLLASGCSPRDAAANTTNWYDELYPDTFEGFPKIEEDAKAVYYQQDGLWRYDKSTRTSEQLLEASAVYDFCILDGYIYYIHTENNKYRPEGDDRLPLIFRIPLAGGQPEAAWSIDMFRDEFEGCGNMQIAKIQAIDDLICFMDSSISMVAYCPKTGKTFRLLDDYGSMTVIDGWIYYVGRWTLSAWKKPLHKPEETPVLILGTGRRWEEGEDYSAALRIFDVCAVGKRLFFTDWGQRELLEYRESGKHKLIYTYGEQFTGGRHHPSQPISANGKLYFCDEQNALRCYDPKSKTISIVCSDEAFVNRNVSDTQNTWIYADLVFFLNEEEESVYTVHFARLTAS